MNYATEISALRKSGKLDEAFARARECHEEKPNDSYIQQAYGWVLYGLLKREVEDFEQKRCSPGHVAHRFNEYLEIYMQFSAIERPGMLHSLLLTQVLKGSRVWSGFLPFARWWGPEFVRDEDKEPYILPDGKAAPGLEMRLFYAIGRAAVHDVQSVDPDTFDWASAQLSGALEKHSDDQWLHYYQSKLLLDRGLVADARECLMPVVRRQQRAAWVWTLLGQTFEGEAIDTAITCYFRAVQLAQKPMEVLNTRIALAQLLAAQERFDEAAPQVKRALDYRIQNSYKIPQDLVRLSNADWYRERADRRDLPGEPDVSAAANVVVHASDTRALDYRLGVVDNQNPAKALAHIAFTADEGTVLHYRSSSDVAKLRIGEVVEVGFAAGEHRASHWRRASTQVIDGFCHPMTGTLTQRDGQSFAFLITQQGERVFVHPALLTQVAEAGAAGQLSCIAMMGKDKQGRQGWRVLCWAHGRP